MIPSELGSALINHLWQSTVVVAIAWLLALALRKNHARARYWVWMAASVKFVLPFSLLMAAGEWLRSFFPAHVVAQPAVANAMEQIAQPFAQAEFFDPTGFTVVRHHGNWLPVVLLAVWACGVLVVLLRFARGCMRVYAAKSLAVRTGSCRSFDFALDDTRILARAFQGAAASRRGPGGPHDSRSGDRRYMGAADVPVLLSTAKIEPGIVGIFRPVLLLREGILERLTAEQMNAIVAHEMCLFSGFLSMGERLDSIR